MVRIIALSVLEAELYVVVQCVMYMMYIWYVLYCFGLTVKLLFDNIGTVNFCNNWSVAGLTRHIKMKQYFLSDLKEAGILNMKQRSGDSMTSDLFTNNNLGGTLFENYGSKFY